MHLFLIVAAVLVAIFVLVSLVTWVVPLLITLVVARSLHKIVGPFTDLLKRD